MSEVNVSDKLRLKKLNKIGNYLIEKLNQNKLMSKKQKNVYRVLNYNDHLLLLICTVTERFSISVFASLVRFPIGITSSPVGLKIGVITAEITKHKPIIKKKRRITIKYFCQQNLKRKA